MSVCDKCNHNSVCGYQDDATLACSDFQKEVVRCKDCTYCDKAFGDYWCNYNWNYAPPIKPKLTREDGFCHNGERKDNG